MAPMSAHGDVAVLIGRASPGPTIEFARPAAIVR